jgi:hypothetical protein
MNSISHLRSRIHKQSDLEMQQTQEANVRKASLLQVLLGSGTHADTYSDTYFKFLVAQIKSSNFESGSGSGSGSSSFASNVDDLDLSNQDVLVKQTLADITQAP